MLGQKSTPLKNKLDSAMVRPDRLCLRGDDDELRDENKHGQRAKLFERVFQINYNLPSRLFSPSALGLIRDTGNILCNRISIEGYEESQDDIQTGTGPAEDTIRCVATSRMRLGYY